MNRVAWFIICTFVGLEMIACGLLVPAHIRALDAKVLEVTGSQGDSLVTEGVSLINLERIGPARMLLQVAQQTSAVGWERLAAALRQFEERHPKLRVWGGAALYLERIFEQSGVITNTQRHTVIDVLVSPAARHTLLQALRQTRRPGVTEILQTRNLTNTVIFPPAQSASGQPLDATILTSALLMQQDQFGSGLRNALQAMVSAANRGLNPEPLESFYLDMLALGKRLDWIQLVELLKKTPDTNALQHAAALFREHEAHLPVIYSALHFAESPVSVALYLQYFPKTGLQDLTFALRSGGNAVRQLLQRQQPVHYPTYRNWLVSWGPVRAMYEPLARVATNQPAFGFIIKYGLCLMGTLLLARALTYLSPSLVDEILTSRPFVTGPQMVIGLCLLFTLLFFSESMVTRATPAPPAPIRLKFPMASASLRAKIPERAKAMIEKNLFLSLLVFFLIQAVIYVFCRMKLAEIRRQTLPSKLKLRLLENEEHLFDAGLYFGFVGTVVSLILVSLGIMKVGIMSAYASTSFGIIFVSIVKIFHVRPFRRRLILDAEMADQEVQVA